MRKSRYTEEQIVGILKESEVAGTDLLRLGCESESQRNRKVSQSPSARLHCLFFTCRITCEFLGFNVFRRPLAVSNAL